MSFGTSARLSNGDRRWISLAFGLFAFWLQLIAPFSMIEQSHRGLADGILSDALTFICQSDTIGSGQQPSTGKSKNVGDCQVCQTLHLLAASLAPDNIQYSLRSLPAHEVALSFESLAKPLGGTRAFSSRAPPVA